MILTTKKAAHIAKFAEFVWFVWLCSNVQTVPPQLVFKETCKYGRLRRPIYSPFGYRRVEELFRMKNIWNDNLEGMT